MRALVFVAAIMVLATPVLARQMKVLDSQPKAEEVTNGRNARYLVRFDGPVDHRTARMWIVRDGQAIAKLPVLLDSAPEVIFGSAPRLESGTYQLHWSVTSAPDKEATEGSFNFTVKKK